MLLQEEVWKDVKGFKGYYKVSNKGRIKSLHRTIIRRDGQNKTFKEKFLLPSKGSYGSLIIPMSKDGKMRNKSYKQLLREHFGKDFSIVNQAPLYTETPGEIFKPIRGYEGLYEISNLGTIVSLSRSVVRKDGFDRSVCRKVLSHNYFTICLSKDNVSATTSFATLLMEAFYPEFNREEYYVRKMSTEGNLLSQYQYFRRLSYNPVTMMGEDGLYKRFSTYRDCATYVGTSELGFLDLFFKGSYYQNGKPLNNVTFTFDYPVLYKEEIKIVSVMVTPIKDKSKRLAEEYRKRREERKRQREEKKRQEEEALQEKRRVREEKRNAPTAAKIRREERDNLIKQFTDMINKTPFKYVELYKGDHSTSTSSAVRVWQLQKKGYKLK